MKEDMFSYDQKECPTERELIQFSGGSLPEARRSEVEYHLTFCEHCLALLTTARQSEVPEQVVFPKGFMERVQHVAHQSWLELKGQQTDPAHSTDKSPKESMQELFEKWKDRLIDLGRSYGIGTLIGPVRIVAEQPAFPLRGSSAARKLSKVLEVGLKDNLYSLEVGVVEQNLLSWNIAGIRIMERKPLEVSVLSDLGEEVCSAECDNLGNGLFTCRVSEGSHYVVVLRLAENQTYLIIRIPSSI